MSDISEKYDTLAGRIGNTKEALVLITQELSDIEQAIAFCKEHDDMELWEDLIQYSLNKPGKQFILNVVYNFNK
jgi:hypothetical protein